ncbi:MAG: 6-phospho-beta-glucosidase [Bryobacteraceae bacterium]
MRKVVVIGAGGVRTPLLIYGIAQSQSALRVDKITLFDIDRERLEVIARLCREVSRQFPGAPAVEVQTDLDNALEGAQFVLHSIRVGGMAARARDERIAIEHGLAGQETTGPGGAAMALRTLPAILGQARTVESVAPDAWFINFTNPAGLITQALSHHTKLKVIGICDTPAELFHQIASALGERLEDMRFDYAGLNHLGWISRIFLRGEDITGRVLDNLELLRRIYSADLFDPGLIHTLRLIPTEYLFFYYSQRRALTNQQRAGATRGEEIQKLNDSLFRQLKSEDPNVGLESYRRYLNQRNSSYMQLEAQAGSAFSSALRAEDPFNLATGYHRIAVDVMRGLTSSHANQVVVNVQNRGTISGLNDDDIVEVLCDISENGPVPRPVGELPESVRGLVLSVKAYERTLIRAGVSRSRSLAALALLEYPIVGDWELAKETLEALRNSDATLSYLA